MTPPAGPAPDETCEVLIVGAGPTGLLLAALLAQRGVDVLVLERRTARSTHSRAIGLHPPAVEALAAVCLGDAAVAAGVPIRGGSARSRGRELGRLRFERVWPARPFVLALPQSRSEELLEHRLAELAPGVLRRGWEVTALQETSAGVEVTARRASPAGTNGPRPAPRESDSAAGEPGSAAGKPDSKAREPGTAASAADAAPLRLRARMLVGADGAHSQVRDLLRVGTTGGAYRDAYLMGDFPDPAGTPEDRDAVLYLEPGGIIESFPLPDGRRRWVAHTGTTPPPAADPALLARIVRCRTGVGLDAASASMISAFEVRRRTAHRLVTRRCVLIGDAAHEISPIGGQGITLGWLDALDLAPLLQRTAADGSRSPLPSRPEWRRFERICRRRARIAGLLAHVNMALGRPLPTPTMTLRNLGVRAALRTPARRAMAWAYSMGWVRRLRLPPPDGSPR